MMRLNRELNCSFLLAVRSELLEEAPQIFGVLLVLNPRKRHFGARNLRLGIFDVFLEGPFVPDDPGIFVRIRVIVAWHLRLQTSELLKPTCEAVESGRHPLDGV